ncbi:hypothetical protein ACNI3K_01445 [Demequina sp. SO4-13]|uniref:hypothetical protein n=1 Tax=Demequina sp. SO4-13 TaxID=3401027 RepID=UPI003AF90C05
MKTLIIALLVLWLLLAVVGFVVEALLWLAFIGLILFAATAVYWWVKNKRSRGSATR